MDIHICASLGLDRLYQGLYSLRLGEAPRALQARAATQVRLVNDGAERRDPDPESAVQRRWRHVGAHLLPEQQHKHLTRRIEAAARRSEAGV